MLCKVEFWVFFLFSSRRRHTRFSRDWSSDVCSSDLGRWRSRIKGFREVRGEFPVATLADEIEAPGEGQVRALITVAGNPLLSTPHSDRLDRAMRGLACVVCVDPYRNETTRHAHVILPPPSSLARSQYELVFLQLAVRRFAKWSAPVVSHEGPSEEDILAKLAL